MLISEVIQKWCFMSSELNLFAVTVVYFVALYYANLYGRDEWEEKGMKVIRIFFAVMAVLNWYSMLNTMYLVQKLNYSLMCQPLPGYEPPPTDEESSSKYWGWGEDEDLEEKENKRKLELEMARALWLFMIEKLLEYLDQIIFALAGFEVSKTEVVHHTMMAWLSWYGAKYYYGGSTSIWSIISCSYLAVAYTFQTIRRFSTNPKDGDYWNRYRRTVLDMKYGHFALTGAHCLTICTQNCGYPRHISIVILVLLGTFVYMIIPTDEGGGRGGGRRRRQNQAEGAQE